MTDWTTDDLSTPAERLIAGSVITQRFIYRLMHDVDPTRWYVTRTYYLEPERAMERTVVYGFRNAPKLQTLWNAAQQFRIVPEE